MYGETMVEILPFMLPTLTTLPKQKQERTVILLVISDKTNELSGALVWKKLGLSVS